MTAHLNPVLGGNDSRKRDQWPRPALHERGVASPNKLWHRLDALALGLLSRVIEAPVAELGHVVQGALFELGIVLGVDHVTLWASSKDRSDFVVRSGWSDPSAPHPWPLDRLGQVLPQITPMILRGEPVESPSVASCPAPAPHDQASLEAREIRSFMALPLLVGGAIEGALSLARVRRAGEWPADLTAGLRPLGHAVAMALLRARLEGPRAFVDTPALGSVERKSAVGLTDRQLEVLGLLHRGHTMKEVAQLLGISPRTVAFHKCRMREITGAKTNAELIRKALEAGLGER